MNWMKTTLCIGALGLSNQLLAEVGGTDDIRHSTVEGRTPEVAVAVGSILTLQHASDSRIHDEGLVSVDIVATYLTRTGRWLLYVEGDTSPNLQGVSTLLPEANQDAGAAVDRDDKGRLQVSELNYLRDLGANALALGLINPAGPVDNSDIANSEVSEFLGTTLVNNPTIAFPDYALGMVYFYRPAANKLELTFLLTSSNGLGDNPDKSYAELVDVTAAGKGVFAVTEVKWSMKQQHIWRMGVWLQTADNAYLNGSGNTADNYGVYLSADHQLGQHRLNVRLGLANPTVSEAAQFIGFAVEHPLGNHTAGIGYTKTFVSDQAVGKADRSQYEAYIRFSLDKNLSLTPSLQRIQNSNFDNSGTTVDSDVYVIGVRASYEY